MDLATILRQQRKRAELSQEQLAQRLHVSRQTISNWENGKSLPDIYSLVALSDLFGVSLDAFIKGDLAVQKRLNPDFQIAPWFVAGTCFNSFLTVINNKLMGTGIDLRLLLMLIIGQLLFSVFLLANGRGYAKLNLERRPDGTKVVDERLFTWLMYYAAVISTVLTVIFGILSVPK